MEQKADRWLRVFKRLLWKKDLNRLIEIENYLKVHVYESKHDYVWFWERKKIKIRRFRELIIYLREIEII